MPGLGGKRVLKLPEEGLDMPALMIESSQILGGKALGIQKRCDQSTGTKAIAVNAEDSDRYLLTGF